CLSSFFKCLHFHLVLPSFPTRRSSDLYPIGTLNRIFIRNCLYQKLNFIHFLCFSYLFKRNQQISQCSFYNIKITARLIEYIQGRSEEHTSELQSRENLVCRLLLEKKN